MQDINELEYLRELAFKYHSSHYVRKYFGFSFKEIAQKVGINYTNFIRVLNGERTLPEKYARALTQVFKEMDIRARTEGFVESENQKAIRELVSKKYKISIDKTKICLILITTMANATFLNPAIGNFPQYITTLFKLASNFTQALKTVVAIKATAVLFFLQQNYRKSRVSLLGHYGPSCLM